MDFTQLEEIEITGNKHWNGIWVNTFKLHFNQILWVRKETPNSHPLGSNNLNAGLKNGMNIRVIK